MKNKITALAAMLAFTLSLAAQSVNSPYSRLGYGLLNDNASASQWQMGGVGYASNSGRQINVMNPASYAMVDTLTFLFDMGLDLTFANRFDADGSSRHETGGGLDYITMQFPITKRLGVSLGMLPYSSVGYAFGASIDNGSSAYEGTGGINLLYAGIGYQPVKGLAVGVNIGYLFGTSYHDVYATTNSSAQSLFEQVMEVRDYHIDFGIQYAINLDRRNRITAGVTYTPGKSLHGHTWVQKYDLTSDTSIDTLDYTGLKKYYSVPDTWGVGLAWEWRKSLTVEADFTYQPWSKADFASLEGFGQTVFADRYKGALGVEYVPNQRGNYMQRVAYRIGGYYSRDYVMVDNNNVKDWGLTCGFGLPAPGSKTVINLGFEYKRRQSSPTVLVKENYFNVRLGINFNATWFQQSKIY